MRWTPIQRLTTCALWTLPVLFLAAGCGEKYEWPETYPIRGKVVYEDGKPLTTGLITFNLVSDPETRAYGKIGKDGTFTLDALAMAPDATSKRFEKEAVAGEYHVNIYPYPGGPGGGRGGYTLKKTYKIEPKENNELTILMEKPVLD
jgi:hypothetical protein